MMLPELIWLRCDKLDQSGQWAGLELLHSRKLRVHDDLGDFAWMPDTRELCARRPFVVGGAWKVAFDLGNILA